MSKEFIQAPLSKKVTEYPESPYLKAKQEWDSRIGETVVQAKNWRLVAVALALSSFLLVSSLVVLALRQKEIPVVIALNSDTGEPTVLGRLSELHYQPKLQEIKYFLSEFIKKVRSVPSDPVLIKKNWLDAYLFLRREAANKLNTITNTDRGGALNYIGKQTVIVQPIAVVQVGNSNSYQLRWSEARYNKNGGLMEKYLMSGVFTIEFDQPQNEEIIAKNPLGIFITSFGWTKEL